MDEKTAWESFQRTGSVLDYLEYRAAKEQRDENPQREEVNADQYRWADRQRTEYR